jgi:hypothetical protein
MTIFNSKYIESWIFGSVEKVDRSNFKQIDRILSRSIDFKIDRSNFCGTETLANSINTSFSHFLNMRSRGRDRLGAPNGRF